MDLPLFPLHVVLFPGRQLPLHLFEERYRRMLKDCLEANQCFGVVAIRAGREAGHVPEIFSVGTVARIEQVAELPDGRYDIVTRGTERFRVLDLLSGTPYLRADVELLHDSPSMPDVDLRAKQLRKLLLPYLASLGAPEEMLAHVPSDSAGLAWLAATALQVEVPHQQRLLELDTPQRIDETLRVLRQETALMRHFGTVGSLRPPGPGGAELN